LNSCGLVRRESNGKVFPIIRRFHFLAVDSARYIAMSIVISPGGVDARCLQFSPRRGARRTPERFEFLVRQPFAPRLGDAVQVKPIRDRLNRHLRWCIEPKKGEEALGRIVSCAPGDQVDLAQARN